MFTLKETYDRLKGSNSSLSHVGQEVAQAIGRYYRAGYEFVKVVNGRIIHTAGEALSKGPAEKPAEKPVMKSPPAEHRLRKPNK